MSDDKKTQFHFDFGGITIEVSGEKSFVQELYRSVMGDVEIARKAAGREITEPPSSGEFPIERTPSKNLKAPEAVWVHRASDMMRKIYMVNINDVRKTPLGDILDVGALSTIYVEKGVFDRFFPDLENNQTLWAEFTQAGRQKIAEVTEPMRKSAQGRQP